MLFTIGFCVACAIFAYLYLSWLWIIGVAALFLAVFLGTVISKYRWAKIISMILLGCGVGCGWTWLFDYFYVSPVTMLDGINCEVCITATDYSYETEYGTASDGLVLLEEKPYLVRFYLDDKVFVEPGDRISGSFRFRLTTAGGNDNPTYHRGEGQFLLLYETKEVGIKQAEQAPWFCYPAVWRQKLLDSLAEMFPEDVAGFTQALLLGERDKLDYETQTALKCSGIQHVVAVSGLHVSILCGLLYLLTLRRRYAALLIGAPVLLLFAAVVGFTPSVTRACVMQILILLADVTDREHDPFTDLAFSVLVMLSVNPMTVTSVSFQLSVGCMIGIFLFHQKIKAWIQSRKWFGSAKGKGIIPRLKRWFSSSVSITLSAMVVTTPFVAYYFGAVSLISAVTNLLTLWCISFIFYGVVVCCAVCFLNLSAATVLAGIVAWPIRYVVMLAKLCAKIPFAAVYTQSVYIIIWLVVCYILLIVFFLIKDKHPVVLLACCSGLLLFALLASWAEPRLYSCYATFLDVEQGQCIILQSGSATYIVDCGGSSDTETADLAAETLLSRGISRVDGIILTHYDRDHAGGVTYLLTRIQADHIYLPDIADNFGTGAALSELSGDCAVKVHEDMRISFAGGNLQIFGPIAFNLGNESSLCVLFQTENCDILITGDRGELGEMLLLREHTLPKLEVLVAGHHGSAGSTSERLLEATKPELVIISLAENNVYGHPSQTLLDRLAEVGCAVYRTDQNGTILYRRLNIVMMRLNSVDNVAAFLVFLCRVHADLYV